MGGVSNTRLPPRMTLMNITVWWKYRVSTLNMWKKCEHFLLSENTKMHSPLPTYKSESLLNYYYSRVVHYRALMKCLN